MSVYGSSKGEIAQKIQTELMQSKVVKMGLGPLQRYARGRLPVGVISLINAVIKDLFV